MTDPILARKLQELINRYGHDAVANAFPPKKILNDVDRERDRNRVRNSDSNRNYRDNNGVAATPIINNKPPDDTAPSIESNDPVNNEKIKDKKYAAIEGMIIV